MSVHLHKVEKVQNNTNYSPRLQQARLRPHRNTYQSQQDLSEIESKINSVLSTLGSLEGDIVEYKREKVRKKLEGASTFDYIKAGFMYFIVIGVPFIMIEVFARDWGKVGSGAWGEEESVIFRT